MQVWLLRWLLLLLRRLLGISGVLGWRSAVARGSGDGIAVTMTWINAGLSVLLSLPIDKVLTVRGGPTVSVSRRRLVVTIQLLRSTVDRNPLMRLRGNAGLLKGGSTAVSIGGRRVRCGWISSRSMSSAEGNLVVCVMLNVAWSRIIRCSRMMNSLLLGTVPDYASVLRVVARRLTVCEFRYLNRKNGDK